MMMKRALSACLALPMALPLISCFEPAQEDLESVQDRRVEVYFNRPGASANVGTDTHYDNVVISLIDNATATVDVATMGFSRYDTIQALVRAWRRGVQVRFVGDARHMHGNVRGYQELDRLGVPMQIGNQNHIMHDKFFIIDGLFVATGTGNTTSTGFDRNNNNWIVVESPSVAQEFTDEFEQMFNGRFGFSKEFIDNGEYYPLGDTDLEVYFSPQEDAMGRLIAAVDNAQQSVEFTIFAFTKDQVGSSLIAKHYEFERYNLCCDPEREEERAASGLACEEVALCEETFTRRYVRGLIDQSQLHSNGPYHEVWRLIAHGIDIRRDGNDNSRTPGDYQAGGGRLHTKTMTIDAGAENPLVVTGSFNWSSSATQSNDETLMIVHGDRITDQYHDYFVDLWRESKTFGNRYIGDETGLQQGDIIFNELHWDGWNGNVDPNENDDDVFNDEFIELLNTTDRPIDLSMWVIAGEDDFVAGMYPGTVIGPYERFLLLDHNTEPYNDLIPQQRTSAFQNGDYVMNTANDNRFLRPTLHNLDLSIRLLDPRGRVMDVAGDGGPAFHGGRQDEGGNIRNYSMERIHITCPEGDSECVPFGPGDLASSWQQCQASEGGENVRGEYRSSIIATPGQRNSGSDVFPDEEWGFRY